MHGYRDVFAADVLATGRVEAAPAAGGQIDFGPGVRRRHIAHRRRGKQVSADEARSEAAEATGFDEQGRHVAARAPTPAQRFRRRLHTDQFAYLVVDVLHDLLVDGVEQVRGSNISSRFPNLPQPFSDVRAVLRISGEQVDHQVDLLHRVVVERKAFRLLSHHEFRWAFFVVLDHDLARDDELVTSLGELDRGHAVTVDVTMPADRVRWLNLQPRRLDANIVSLTRSE